MHSCVHECMRVYVLGPGVRNGDGLEQGLYSQCSGGRMTLGGEREHDCIPYSHAQKSMLPAGGSLLLAAAHVACRS